MLYGFNGSGKTTLCRLIESISDLGLNPNLPDNAAFSFELSDGSNPRKWAALLDEYELPDRHWSRLISPEPFDLAQLLRDRGMREPTISDFAV